MVEQYKKFLKKLNPNQITSFVAAIKAIQNDDLSIHDIQKLNSKDDIYRLRIGKYRIIFLKSNIGNKIVKIQARGDVYK